MLYSRINIDRFEKKLIDYKISLDDELRYLSDKKIKILIS